MLSYCVRAVSASCTSFAYKVLIGKLVTVVDADKVELTLSV